MLIGSEVAPAFDLAVVGAGPAAHAVAAAVAERGLRVGMVAPSHRRLWHARFGMWASELPVRYQAAVARHWDHARVVLDEAGQDERALPHAYVALDTSALQKQMQVRSESASVQTLRGHVVGVEHDRSGSWIRLADARTVRARVVVDASGASSTLVRRYDRRAPAFQTAFGQLLRVPAHAFKSNCMTLMDFSGFAADEPATFLYAQPLDDQHLFVEETSLVARPGMPRDFLQKRLALRLQRLGIRTSAVLDEENCTIAMGTALPRRSQQCVAFGAAGSFVHPATGYQLARALNEAEGVAGAICEGLDKGGPAVASRLAYAAIWPNSRLRSWELYTFGMNVLCGFNAKQTRQFMATFFSLPERQWLGFLQATLAPRAIAQAMFNLFGDASSDLRARLFRFGAGPGLPTLIRAVTPRMSL